MCEIELVEEEEFKFPVVDKAKYKIEIFFTDERSMHHDYRGVIKCWERGGGADTSIYFCPKCYNVLTKDVIGPMYTYKGKPCKEYYGAVCAKCGRQFDGTQLVDMVSYRCSTARWVDVIEFFYQRLGGDVDFYLKHQLEKMFSPLQEYHDRPNYRNARGVAHTVISKSRLLLPRDAIVKESMVTPVRSIIRAFISA
jgi:hypothetical protein